MVSPLHTLRRRGAVVSVVCLLAVFSGPAAGAAPQDLHVTQSPLRVLEARPNAFVTPLAFDAATYNGMKSADRLRLTDFAVAAERRLDLDLHRIDVFAPDARVVLGTPNGDVPVPRPDVLVFGGRVVGHPGSTAVLGLSPHGCNGLIELDGETFVVSAGPHDRAPQTVIYNTKTLPAGAITLREFVNTNDVLLIPGRLPSTPADGGDAATRDNPCRIADVAVETDYEFTGWLFGGDTDASAAYVATLLGAVSEIYTRDFNVRLQIRYLRLWPTSNDPWTGTDTIDQLYQYQDYWNANMTDVQRHVVHYLSGRALGGGVAYLGALCYPDYDYGLSANIAGYFPYPIQNNHSQNWDLMVVSHEMGHNFGAPHTHDMVPPIDNCAGGDCSICPNATIMSYCHLCPGGMVNIRMEFHPRIINEEVIPFLDDDAPCNIAADAPTITDQPDSQTVDEGDSATFSVTATGTAPLSYQWRKGGVDLTDDGNVSGATTDTLVIDPVGMDDAGDYDVVVANACESQTSATATLTVENPVLGDFDGDGDVDLDDFALFTQCFAGADNPPAAGCQPGVDADFDGDGDVDLGDFAIFGQNFTGAL